MFSKTLNMKLKSFMLAVAMVISCVGMNQLFVVPANAIDIQAPIVESVEPKFNSLAISNVMHPINFMIASTMIPSLHELNGVKKAKSVEVLDAEPMESVDVENSAAPVVVPTAVPEPVVEEVVEETPPEPAYDFSSVPLSQSELDTLIAGCKANNIPIPVALGLIETESRFTYNAVSYAGCYGYMQLNPRYFPSNLSSEDNITYGLNYLGENLAKCGGNMTKALDMYHCGHVTGDTYYPGCVMEDAYKWSSITGITI